jgi:hypothetical protein
VARLFEALVASTKKTVRAWHEYPTLHDEATKDGPPDFCLKGLALVHSEVE